MKVGSQNCVDKIVKFNRFKVIFNNKLLLGKIS